MSRPPVDLCVMLAGGLKPSPLAAAAGRSVLDLSADGRRTILEHWLAHLGSAIGGADQPPIPVRILHGSHIAPSAPDPASLPPGLDVTIERETKEFRGPAGVVKDAAEHLPPDATVLVIEAARWFAGDLGAILHAHWRGGGAERSDVTVTADSDSSPAGIVVLQRSTLDLVSELGFIDLKEQWLGRLAERGKAVRVFDLGASPCILLRERAGLLAAARSAAAGARQARSGSLRPLYAESDQGYFAAVSPHSRIESNTSIVDSVIMDGAVVGTGAIVARSVICPGAVVAPSEVVVDHVRTGNPVRAPIGRSADRPNTPPRPEAVHRGQAPGERAG